MPVIVGLTGGIATGKSSASSVFASHGIPIVDADEIARQGVRRGSLSLTLIRWTFGRGVLAEDGSLDREKMGQLVFADAALRRRLQFCTHPFIILEMVRQLVVHCFVRFSPLIILDVPLLFESKGLVWLCTETVVVNCTAENQLRRLMQRNHFSGEEAKRRIASQMPLDVKCEMATHVIDNDGNLDDLRTEIETLLTSLRPPRARETLFRCIVGGIYLTLVIAVGRLFLRD